MKCFIYSLTCFEKREISKAEGVVCRRPSVNTDLDFISLHPQRPARGRRYRTDDGCGISKEETRANSFPSYRIFTDIYEVNLPSAFYSACVLLIVGIFR